MIRVLDAAAVLTSPGTGFDNAPKLRIVTQKKAQRVFSPCAGYAIEAVELLAPEVMPRNMLCLCGPTGIMADAFLPATKGSEQGTLEGPDFPKRSRRIHPLNLIRNLQNQVPSALSQVFDIRGRVLNALESPSALAYMLPNVETFLETDPYLLLVMASAGDRREEKAKRLCFKKGTVGQEGAFVFLLGRQGGHGQILSSGWEESRNTNSRDTPGDDPWGDSILAAGALLMTCFLERPTHRQIPLQDAWGHRSAIHWKD